MTTLARFVLRVFLGIAVLGGCSWAVRAPGNGTPTPVPKVHREPAVSARCAPVLPHPVPTLHLNRPAGRPVGRPKPTAGFAPFSAALAPSRPAPFRAHRRLVVHLPHPTRFFSFFLRFVLGHQIAAQAP